MAIDKKRPLQSSSAHNVAAGDPTAARDKTIEETYQKKTQLEHILLRPDTYIGSVERHTQALWVYEGDQMVHRSVTYVPGLYKIFDEILVNAADNKQRDPSMDAVRVEIDQAEGRICVYNNGDGIPVEVHREEGVYVPELIFGHLLTSSNYDDAVKKTTGGRNGYGAKLTNIFSTEFVVETADSKRQKKYKQVVHLPSRLNRVFSQSCLRSATMLFRIPQIGDKSGRCDVCVYSRTFGFTPGNWSNSNLRFRPIHFGALRTCIFRLQWVVLDVSGFWDL